jgi:hypothetical protein
VSVESETTAENHTTIASNKKSRESLNTRHFLAKGKAVFSQTIELVNYPLLWPW